VQAEETEFVPGGEAHIKRAGSGSSEEDFEAYLFHKKNPRGVHVERWRHAYGCGKWFHVVRCTTTHEVYGAYAAQTHEPPADLCQVVRERHPDWSWP